MSNCKSKCFESHARERRRRNIRYSLKNGLRLEHPDKASEPGVMGESQAHSGLLLFRGRFAISGMKPGALNRAN